MKYKLSDISLKISKGSTPRKKVNYTSKEKNYFLRVTDMEDFKYVVKSELTLSDEDIIKNKIKIWPNNTVLVSIEGTVGKIGILNNEMCFNQAIAGIIPNEEKVNPKYLMYYLKTTALFTNILRGTIMPAIRLSDLANIDIELPNLEIQNRVVKLIDVFTYRIELNNQINNNLLEIIQRIIKEKFYNGKLELVPISKFGKIQGGYAFKSKDLFDDTTKNRIVKIKNINASKVDLENTQYILDSIAMNIDKKFQLLNGNVIIAMTGAELGKTGFIYGTNDKYFLNQRVGVVRGNSDIEELYLNQIFLLDSFQKMLNSKGYGSAQPNISTSDIENIEIPNPSLEELNKFYKFVNPMYNMMIENNIENRNLEQLRDALLPKLMNGEIDLKDIEI